MRNAGRNFPAEVLVVITLMTIPFYFICFQEFNNPGKYEKWVVRTVRQPLENKEANKIDEAMKSFKILKL